MGTVNIWEKILDFIKKYKYVAIILVVGIVLMLIPTGKQQKQTQQITQTQSMASADVNESLEKILCQIEGAGKVRVLITVASGEEIVYQSNNKTSLTADNNNTQSDTVTVTDSDRNQNGLIKRKNAPVYRGAVVVCEGADSAPVRLAIVEAVSKVTGLTADRITVLKMK